jgi:chemotaxis protein CheD
MLKPDHVIEIFLQPGDFYFGDRNTRIRSLLGSCIAVTMWHPQRLLGGMCHYMLPFRSAKKTPPRQYQLDGRYAEEAMLMFFREAIRQDTDPRKYVVKVFGGGNMFPDSKRKRSGTCTPGSSKAEIMACPDVSCKNISAIHLLAKQYGFHIAAEHMGGIGHRNIIFDVWSGHVWMRKAGAENTES